MEKIKLFFNCVALFTFFAIVLDHIILFFAILFDSKKELFNFLYSEDKGWIVRYKFECIVFVSSIVLFRLFGGKVRDIIQFLFGWIGKNNNK